MNKEYICQQSGKFAYIWEDGLFETIYCVCGAKITVTDDLERSPSHNKYVRIPQHYTRSLKRK